MRRAWPPVYRPFSQQKVVPAAASVVPPPLPPTARYRRETVASAAASGPPPCFVIAAVPCSSCTCSGGPQRKASAAGPSPAARNNQQWHSAAVQQHHRVPPPPPLPARNGCGGGGCPYRCCAARDRPQKTSPTVGGSTPLATRPPLQQQCNRQYAQQPRCAYVRPRPSRSLENLLRVVELDEMAAGHHRGVYEKSCRYGNPRRKMKVAAGKENKLLLHHHAWKRRSMESLLSARDAAALATKHFKPFYHVRHARRSSFV